MHLVQIVIILYSILLISLFIILISVSSLFSFYFYFELQWIIISYLFIIGNSLYRGLISYFIINSIISIWLLIAIISSNSFLFILSLYSKLGYFPFILIYLVIINSSSFIFIFIDIIFKWCYINALINWNNINISNLITDSLLLIINLFFITLITWFLFSIKHILFISSLFLILLILILLLINNEFYCFIYYITYIIFNYSLINIISIALY